MKPKPFIIHVRNSLWLSSWLSLPGRRRFYSGRTPRCHQSDLTAALVGRSQALRQGSDPADSCEDRYDGRRRSLPETESDTLLYKNRVAVPVQYAVAINAQILNFTASERSHAVGPLGRIRLSIRRLSRAELDLCLRAAHRHSHRHAMLSSRAPAPAPWRGRALG